jgi:hypothetical protein
MKLSRPLWTGLTLALGLTTQAFVGHSAALDEYIFVQANGAQEWSASGDFDGNGLLDAVVVDRLTGSYRLGYQTASGVHTWVAPRASGIAGVSGFSVGHIVSTTEHGLAFASEAANRVNVVAAINPAQESVPASVFLAAVGPNQVVAVNIGGGGDTLWQDLVVATVWNGALPFRTTTVRNVDGANFSALQESAATQRWERGNRVVFRRGSPSVLAVLARGTTDTLRLISYQGGPPESFLQFENLASGSEYITGHFANTGLAHFLTYRPGQTNGWAHAVLEPMPGTYQPGAAVEFQLNGQIQSLHALPGAAGVSAKFAAILDAGTRAAVYAYDGTNAPGLVQEFLPPDGESFLGSTPLENGHLRLHSGVGGRTTRTLQYTFNPGTGAFNLTANDVLPSVSDFSGKANVFQFQFEPFVSTAPRLLSSTHAGDWSSLFSLAGLPPEVGVMTETFANSTQGLDNPTATQLGPSHSQTQFGLANQYTESVSLFSLATGAGSEIAAVRAQPGSGLYARSVAVDFVVQPSTYQVLFRLGTTGAWQAYNGKSIVIFTNTTLQYRARPAFGIQQSSVHTETYQFRETPKDLDSDDDGVPDYVEVANGLDPLSGSDADLDGFTDLEELLENRSPSNPESHPEKAGYEQHAAVDWILTPRPLDGISGVQTTAKPTGHIRAFDLTGASLGIGQVRTMGLLLPPSAIVSNVVLEAGQSILLAVTEPHFDIVTASADARMGREMVALMPAPAVAPIVVDYNYGSAGGLLAAEAQNWVAAAKLAHQNSKPEVRSKSITVADTLVAALFEEKLRSIVAAEIPDEADLTLFSFRSGDAGRPGFNHSHQDLLSHGDAQRPAYDLRQMLASIETLAVTAPSPQVVALQNMAAEIYRLSAASNNAAPGFYRAPLDVLREFIRFGTLATNYLTTGSFPEPQTANAIVGIHSILDQVGSRPVTNLTLRIRPDTMNGPCVTVETADLFAVPVHLSALGGGPFDFPDTFALLPGTIVEVIGRPDVVSSACAGLNVEVLAISLQAIPARSDGDANGNLLIDSWELLFLGGMGGDPFADEDADGYNNLQEMMEGTDPRDGLGVPSVPIAALQLPALDIEPTGAGSGELALEWTWPEAYVGKVQFQIVATTNLSLPPTIRPLTPVHVGGGLHRVVVPNPGGTQFFKIVLQLRF